MDIHQNPKKGLLHNVLGTKHVHSIVPSTPIKPIANSIQLNLGSAGSLLSSVQPENFSEGCGCIHCRAGPAGLGGKAPTIPFFSSYPKTGADRHSHSPGPTALLPLLRGKALPQIAYPKPCLALTLPKHSLGWG